MLTNKLYHQLKRSDHFRNRSSEIPQRAYPITPRNRASRTGDNESNSSATSTRTSVDRSPKVIVHRSTRSPVTEKKHATRLSELETKIYELQEDLKKTREQLNLSETCKKRSQQEAEETKKQLQDMSAKLDDSQRQLVEFSAAEEARLEELRKISQERDRAWQSELEAIQNQHIIDSAALSSAMNEMHSLKIQLEIVLKSEAAQLKRSEVSRTKIQALKLEMDETLSTVENLKLQLRDSKKLEAEARKLAEETRGQLEMAMTTIQSLSSKESFSSDASESQQPRAEVNPWERLLENLKENDPGEVVCCGELSEVEQLRSELEALEIKYQAGQIQSTMQIQSAYELMEQVKSDYGVKEAELELKLNDAKAEFIELKENLLEKEAEHQMTSGNKEMKTINEEVHKAQMQSELELNLIKSINDMADLKTSLMNKEIELQNVLEDNRMLKSEREKIEHESCKGYEAIVAELNLAKATEQDALVRLRCVTEEAEKNSKAARVAQQLSAAQAMNSEMESEMKRLRIQCDQWRKAAEVAASMLSSSNSERNWRTGSQESDYSSIAGKLMSSPFSDELEEESPGKKKNANMLMKIGGLWKKNPK
ncbi:interactor of constitutive active ROPs 2, chloroplastic isoform X2 [Canna indica]|uniref:Interactor of constitutive active ROPs 2, chloroplastic isoform X2 n=1 Tax=Canna indica TaxID=4628 RepID=A0AAQ3QJD8_9LILI|nr:interactor of constitutive active ROPs 2, chloroplastic isoform X2 [Canna indica]